MTRIGRSRDELLHEVGAAHRDGRAGGDVLVADRERLLEDGVGAVAEAGERAVHAPGEVHGRGSGGAEPGGALADRGLVVGAVRASCATPSAPATPSAGAPRTASRAIASMSGSSAVTRRNTSSSGRRVWSMSRISSSTQSMARAPPASSQVGGAH